MKKTNDGTYWASKKLKNGQTAMMLFSLDYGWDKKPYYNVGFVVANNRKQCMRWYNGEVNSIGYRETGKGTNPKELVQFGIETLKEFIEFMQSIKRHGEIWIEPADKKRMEAYKKILAKHFDDFYYNNTAIWREI